MQTVDYKGLGVTCEWLREKSKLLSTGICVGVIGMDQSRQETLQELELTNRRYQQIDTASSRKNEHWAPH